MWRIGELGRGRASNLTYFTNRALNATIRVIELAGDMQQQPGVHRAAEVFEGLRPSSAARSTISSGCEAPVRKVKLVVTASSA